MTGQTVLTQKKRRGPQPTGKGELIGVRLHEPMLGAIDAWIAGQPDPKPSRPEAIRTGLKSWLVDIGLLPPAKRQSDAG